jgi:putative membrane protein
MTVMHGYGYGWGMNWTGWLFMGLFWALLLGVILWAVVRLLPASTHRDQSVHDSPEEILDRRFASGELDAETYRAQREALAAARGRR